MTDNIIPLQIVPRPRPGPRGHFQNTADDRSHLIDSLEATESRQERFAKMCSERSDRSAYLREHIQAEIAELLALDGYTPTKKYLTILDTLVITAAMTEAGDDLA